MFSFGAPLKTYSYYRDVSWRIVVTRDSAPAVQQGTEPELKPTLKT